MTELKCDFDRERLPNDLAWRIRAVCATQRLTVHHIRYDRTRHGWHVVVTVSGRVSFARQVLLQALLGSDWKRENFNAGRARVWRHVPAFWRERANVLYSRHDRRIAL